jgi:site-specific DNA-methyltransferase (adenine-specific)
MCLSGDDRTMTGVHIYCADSRKLDLTDGSVAITVTSPPYHDAIDYQVHVQNIDKKEKGWYRERKEATKMSDYMDQMREHFTEVWRVTKEGGYCCLILGNEIVPKKHRLIHLPAHFYFMMEGIGWALQEEVIWYKVTGGKKRFRVTVQHPYATYYYANILHEHILVFRKGKVTHNRDGPLTLDDLIKKEIANSRWHIPPVPPNILPHPCPFPEEIPYRLISLYSAPDELVLDNFNGIGQTTKVAYHLGRRAIGYDIVQQYCDTAERRITEPLNLRIPIIPKWIYTCPQCDFSAFKRTAVQKHLDSGCTGPVQSTEKPISEASDITF